MKKLVVDKIMNSIDKQYDYSDTKMMEIKYGIESIYLFITKTIIIFLLAFLLDILKELVLIMIFYSIIRATGFGLHAKKSWHCWVSSILIFIGIPLLITYIMIPKVIGIIALIICIILIAKYAPADTEKRPIINKRRRLIYKICTVLIATIYTITFFVTNSLVSNAVFFSIIIETIMILPVSYKLFNLKYDNYKVYLQKNFS